ncbi:MAG: thiamine-phosphate kinase [Acidiphilium sp. 37-64-53]|uniref:thiamine-phosphate kinase n=1 Tax=Acidiphilium TaxID=522 RepID=UPI000BCA4A43|nr:MULTISPECIES: thiamine-phosphate kinase [Acidiphilium]OYW03529.1 MAG: thiamine-phosphate kinase [Acidiphilium sp. 37-64-53]OZB29527.1 MAG: thiamine-phosphate kinase [Acidiphilium sp. 34-64-41]HQT84177.1 thiamine-phosphate kinase [Acidiphilium rubrum]
MSGGEFDRIARYFAPLANEAALGLTDDAAVWSPPPGRQLVLTVDQMIEGIHFLPDDPPDCVARKLLRRNLSDLAAMGAAPIGYLLTTALRAATPQAWLADFADGLAQDQRTYNITLFGGDSTSTTGPIMTSVTMIGHVAPGTALLRTGARSGDAIFVTGTIGDAVLGLEAARGNIADPGGFFSTRRLLPEPRIGLPLAGPVHAAIDVSDGLIQDLAHLCTNARLGAVIEAALVPQSSAARAAGDAWLETRLTGGDDYELILAAPATAEPALRAACGTVPLTRIGTMTAAHSNIIINDASGTPLHFARQGWQHF